MADKVVSMQQNSDGSFDFGYYGPNCASATTGVPLVFHTGPIAGSSIHGGATGPAALTVSASSVSIPAGWYCLAMTSSAAAPALVLGQDTNTVDPAEFAIASSPGSSTGTTTGATLNSTITAPALSKSAQNGIFTFAF